VNIEARPAHHQFKWRLIELALRDGAAFAKKFSAKDGATKLTALWTEVGAKLPAGDRLAPDGLELEVHGEPASPVMFITMPEPKGKNEAYILALIPTESVPLRFRVFALEKAIYPKTGDSIVFVVETTDKARSNYGPPTDDAPNDTSRGSFVTAILAICDGKRKPLAVTEL